MPNKNTDPARASVLRRLARERKERAERLETANLARYARNMLGNSHVVGNAHRLGALGAQDLNSAIEALDRLIPRLPTD
jgi:hypothetical protein